MQLFSNKSAFWIGILKAMVQIDRDFRAKKNTMHVYKYLRNIMCNLDKCFRINFIVLLNHCDKPLILSIQLLFNFI